MPYGFHRRGFGKNQKDPLVKNDRTREEYLEAVKKLGQYYSLMGFEKWTKDKQDEEHSLGLRIWGISTGHQRVNIKRVVPHLFEYPEAREDML